MNVDYVAAASRMTDVVPANVADQPIRFLVECRPGPGDNLSIRVVVAAGEQELSPKRFGRLALLVEDAVPRPDQLTAPPVPDLWCNVQESPEQGGLVYEFGVAVGLLPRATFIFKNFHPTMPSFDGYRLLLGALAQCE